MSNLFPPEPPEPFYSGDILIVTPSDDLDPEANDHRSQRCQFVRYSLLKPEHAVVKFSTQGKSFVFRAKDLRKAEPQS